MSAYDNWLTQPWEDRCAAQERAEAREARTCIVCLVLHERPLEDYVCDECRAREEQGQEVPHAA
jgi:uncharacterized protein YlaI